MKSKQQRQRHPSLSATSRQHVPFLSGRSQYPAPRTEQERQQREAAERRDRALLWTDDRPFSIYKS